ncbi:HRDC domain-containing protein [Rathayibacter sp. KR2-224]|uniref:HRDC domain-containing protein n=1 Tax=Rathayibacter sp. KR2-224 TaxID=3400913 RepID=UPI003BFEA7AB
MTEYEVVDSLSQYTAAVDALRGGTGPVGVDAERASGFRYSQRAYLIQMFRRDAGVFLFDPPALGGELPALQDAVGDVPWILHAASQDLACLREVGLEPSTIFDTELGARLLGFPRVGLATIVEELLGIHLAKEHSAADWSTRPLPASWLTYAALDVELLVDLMEAEQKLLAEAGKQEIAAQEFAYELAREPKPARSEPWRRLSGVHSIRGLRNLAVARELWAARDELARSRDVAPGRLLPDASITAVARVVPSSKRDLAALKEFTGRASRTELDRWWDAVSRGRTTDDLPVLRSSGESIPPPRAWADRNPEASERLRAARAALAVQAEELRMPVENLLSPETLRRLAWSPPEPFDEETIADALREADARPWQVEATASVVAAAFVEAAQSPVEGPESAS